MTAEQGKILLVGSGETVIDNVMRLVPAEHQMAKGFLSEVSLRTLLLQQKPMVVVACLSDETPESIRVYDCLYEEERFSELPVIAVGHQDDCTRFKKHLPLKNMEVFARPLNRELFLGTLRRFFELSQQAAAKEAEPQKREENPDMTESGFEKKGIKAAPDAAKKSILVVDDDVQMLNAIKLYLQDLYDVTVVPSGKLALKFVEKKPTDLVLLDYMMPEMDGPQVLREIRCNSPRPHVPVLFLTGVSEKESVMRGLEFKPNGYLLKPVSREVLLEKVTEILLGL